MSASKDQVAQIIVGEAQARNHTRDECLAELSGLYQESGWDETIWDPTGTTYGVAQQDGSYPNRFQGAAAQVKAFFDKLDVKRASPGHGDIWLNICWLQQAPNWPSAQYWWDNGRQAYLTEIKSRVPTVTMYLDRYWPTTGDVPVTAPDPADPNKPAYNEFPIWSPNNQSRGGQKPRLACIHTQESQQKPPADNAAESLGNYAADPAVQVSYHDYISQASDGGVTLVNGVNTDYASWSVGDANNYTLNYCIAGSQSSWTTDEWMKYAGNAIDVMAYEIVQDAKKYGFKPTFLGTGGNYNTSDPNASGVTDHRFVTDVIGWGTHTDVGPGFPADYFESRLNFYAGLDNEPTTPPPVVTPPVPPAPTQVGPADDQLTLRWNCLGGQTLVEAVAEMRDKLLGTNDRPKTGIL